VEYLFPYDFDKAELREQLHQHGLAQVLHNLPAGDWAAGERGIAILPDRVDEFRDGVARGIDYAKALDCRQLNCLVGIAPDGADMVELNEVLVNNLRFAADALAKERIRLLIEPINTLDIPGFFLNRQDHAHDLIAEIGAANVKVQMDLYHCQIVEGDVAMKIRQYLPTGNVGHIQIAGVPDRHEPDEGEVTYEYLYALIDALGWRGHIGCEYRPAGATSAGLGWFKPYRQQQHPLKEQE
jgi:hydroxypyruvate isomerase